MAMSLPIDKLFSDRFSVRKRPAEVPITIDFATLWQLVPNSHSKEEEEEDDGDDEKEEWIAVGCSDERARQLSSAPSRS